MGQETSLNCRSSAKQDQHQIQTTQANAINIIKSRNGRQEGLDSDLGSKKSATTNPDNPSSFALSTASHPKNTPSNPPPVFLPQHENILKVANSPFNGSDRQGSRFIERGGKTLAEIVQSRYNSTMHFPQQQVVVLAESLIYSLRYLQRMNVPHHDFYPTNVHYSAGIFKIINPLNLEASAYSLTQQRKRFSFLAPQLISQLLSDTPQADIPQDVLYKADVFAIGMMVLQFCTLQPSAECYDEQNYSLVDKVIKERLVKVAKLYSPNIADCIAEMLRYEVEERISVEELSLLVFLNSPQEKAEPPQERKVQQGPPTPIQPQRQYQQNPPYVQQQFLILPPGAPPPPPGQQVLPLGQNSIAIPTPNYAYTRIGPNNQGLLSPTTLQNKLKVIQLIHQKPQQEEESEGQMSSLPSNLLPTLSNQPHIDHSRQAFGNYTQTYQTQQQTLQQQKVQTNPNVYPSQQLQDNYSRTTKIEQRRVEEPMPTISIRDPVIRQQQIKKQVKVQEKSYEREIPSRQYTRTFEKSQQQYRPPSQTRPAYVTSNKFLSKTDQNGQTLEQRVQRILQMSRSIK